MPSPLLRRLTVTILFAATLISAITAPSAVVQAQANALTEKSVEAIALRWFEQMRTGQMRKVYWRILPLAILTYFLRYLDRINVGYVA